MTDENPTTTGEATPDCEACIADPTRREFLRRASLVGAALAAIAANFSDAGALPVRVVHALAVGAGTMTYPIPAADGAEIDRDNEVILVRWQNQVIAFNLSCPHQKTALRWNPTDARFQCPKHKSQYTPEGTFISGRATRGMDRMAIARQGNSVVVTLDPIIKQTENMPGWQAAVIHL